MEQPSATKLKIRCVLVVLLVVGLAAAACARQGPRARFTLAVVPKATSHEFWISVHAGVEKAVQEYANQGLEVHAIWKGPIREDDREQQVQVLEGFISQGVDGLVLAPLDRRALVRPVEEAKRAGVPTVVIDSALDSDQIVSFVATDNLKAGELAADRIADLLGGRGNVMLLRYQEGSASTGAREEGFLRRLSQAHPELEVVSSDQYAGVTRETAKRASENLLNRFATEALGIFCPNESSTAGMLLALQDSGRAGQAKFVGFDATEDFIQAMRRGELHGVVLQDPLLMGYLGVRTMVQHLQGQPIDARIDTGVQLITPEGLDWPDSQRLLHPPVAEYLK